MSAGSTLLAAPVAVAAAPQAAVPQAAVPQYRVVDLGTLGEGGGTYALAINESGHVAGASNDHAVLWRGGRIIDLGGLTDRPYCTGTDVNDRDEVVGYCVGDSISHAFVWRNGRMRDLGVLPGGDNSYAMAINNAGDIVGWSATMPNNGLHAVRWHAGRMIDMDPGGMWSVAYDITSNGWIVGGRASPDDGVDGAVAWRAGVPTVLMPGMAVAANERHQVVDLWGSVWDHGTVTQLPTPHGASFIQVYGMNNRGQIVGYTDYDAVLWNHGAPAILPRLAGSTTSAYDINNRGQIVGWSATTSNGFHAHAVLWTRIGVR